MAPPPPKLHRTQDHISFADVEMVMNEPSQSNGKGKAFAKLQRQLAKQKGEGKGTADPVDSKGKGKAWAANTIADAKEIAEGKRIARAEQAAYAKGKKKGKGKGKAVPIAVAKACPVAAVPNVAKAGPVDAVPIVAKAVPVAAVPTVAKAGPVAVCPPIVAGSCSAAAHYAADYVQCDFCGSEVVRDTARIHSKKQGKFKCIQCNSVVSRLYKTTGLPDDANWEKSKKNEFYTRCHATTLGNIGEVVSEFSEKQYKNDEAFYENSGGFYPLGWYEKQGFDTARIVANSKPCHVREHPVLGTVYKVVIASEGGRGASGSSAERSHGVGGPALSPPAPVPQTIQELKALVSSKEKEEKTSQAHAKTLEKDMAKLNKSKDALQNLVSTNERYIPGPIKEAALVLIGQVAQMSGGGGTVEAPPLPISNIPYPWALGPMVPWAHGPLGLWALWPMSPWAHGTKGPWAHGPMGAWAHGTHASMGPMGP